MEVQRRVTCYVHGGVLSKVAGAKAACREKSWYQYIFLTVYSPSESPFWATILLFVLTLVPGLFLAILSIAAVAFFAQHFLNTPDMLLALAILQILLGMLWWGWTQIPLFFGGAIHKILQQRRKDETK